MIGSILHGLWSVFVWIVTAILLVLVFTVGAFIVAWLWARRDR